MAIGLSQQPKVKTRETNNSKSNQLASIIAALAVLGFQFYFANNHRRLLLRSWLSLSFQATNQPS